MAEKGLASDVKESVRFIRSRTGQRPGVGVILGSGLGDFAGRLTKSVSLETSAIPHYPSPTVIGHEGRLVFGRIGALSTCVIQGRIHYYETGDLQTVLYPVRVLHGLGVRILVVTNAAGGINPHFHAGDLMIVSDQINLTFANPLHARPMISHRDLYEPALQRTIGEVAERQGVSIRRGIYCGLQGPSYETAAEVEMVRRLGGDAVGMSTVNEVSLACSLGMRVAGISCITNLSTGISTEKLSHAEVTEVADRVKISFAGLLAGTITAAAGADKHEL